MTGPTLSDTLHSRPLQLDDAARRAQLFAAMEAHDQLGEHHDVQDCAHDLGAPETDLAHNSVVVLSGGAGGGADGIAVGYQLLHERTGAGVNALLVDGGVHPANRGWGIGSALIATARQRAAELGRELYVAVPESVADAVALVEDHGMRPARYWSDLVRELAEPVPPVAVPDGLVLHDLGPEFDAARWDEPLRVACNTAFADHWAFVPQSAQRWQHDRTGSRAFRPGCSVAACTQGGEVVGMVLTDEFAADTAATGRPDLYIATVATVREQRRRGLGAAMLARVLQRGREQGYVTASLTVDAENPTGAVGVYTRAGFTLQRRTISYLDSVPAGDLPAGDPVGEQRR